MRHVIIGTGAAGAAAARTIHESDPRAEIILLSEEPHPPYARHLLTDFLCGAVAEEQLFYLPESVLASWGVDLRKGVTVDALRPRDKVVRLNTGEELAYDRLLVATGRRPVMADTLKPFAEHIHGYYSLEDILDLKARMDSVEHVVVSGQVVSVLSLLSGLRALDKEVHYIIRGPLVDIPIVPAVPPEDLDQGLREKGVRIVREDRIASIRPDGSGYAVETYQGLELAADLVFAFEAYRPNVACCRGAGLEMGKGILVDLELHTSAEDVFAAGDCVEIYDPHRRSTWVNFGWPNAVQQGRVAGANMAGARESYEIADTVAFEVLGKPFRARWWE